MTNSRLLLIPALLVLACVAKPAAADPDATQWRDDLPVDKPWLREQLPENTLIYARIPNLYGLLTMPKGNVLDPALRSRTNIENIQAIREAMQSNVFSLVDEPSVQIAAALDKSLQSPLEVALTMDGAPAAMISATLDTRSDEDFESLLSSLGLQTLEPLAADGTGSLLGLPVPAFVRFDDSNGRLLIHTGPAVSPDSFTAIQAALEEGSHETVRRLEQRIDESGQGFLLWIDAERALPMMRTFLQPDQIQKLTDTGFDKLSKLAMGFGVADGKARMSIAGDLLADVDRGFFPLVKNDIEARSVGNPDGLLQFSIPSVDEFHRMEALALAKADTDAQENWRNGKAAVAEFLGFTIEDLLTALGPEFLVIFDEAGDYTAVRIRDKRRWQFIVNRIADKVGERPDSRRIDGKTYYHFAIANEVNLLDDAELKEMGWIGEVLARPKEHMYWTEADGYLYMNTVPQPLIDRAAMKPDTDIGKWLKDTQRMDIDTSIFSISGTSRKLPRRLYAVYLEVLQFLGDFTEADIDVWSMPTARQLDLPETGTIGFTLNLGEPTLAMEMTFENNPVEMLGNMSGVATAGILAAIAIPAYQDYTIRAKVAIGLSLSASTKAAIAEFYATHGRFPNAGEVDDFAQFETGHEEVTAVYVEPDTGRIVVQYGDTVSGGGNLYLQADAYDGVVTWSCSASFEDKHLPAACRAN